MFQKLYAQLACRDLDQGIDWFRRLFGRDPDARPMAGLAEWHHRDNAGLQLFRDPANAGHGTLTVIVDDLSIERSRLSLQGLDPPDIEPADTVSLLRLRDPDDNLVVLAQPM